MKKHLLAYSGALVLAVAACSQTGTGDPTGTAGSSATGTAGTQGSAGTSGSAGNVGSTGSAGTVGGGGIAGADSPGTAGQNGTAGTTGSGGEPTGTAGTGGVTGIGGRGGSTGGSGCLGTSCGGSVGSGGRGGAAGSAAGTTGSAGRGGTTGTGGGGTTGTGGRGGTTGTGGSGGGGACPTIDELIPGFDGYLWQVQPSGNTPLSGTNYPFGSPAGGCPTGASWDTTGYIQSATPLAIKGTSGQKYTINIAARGVVGTRCYTGGKPGSTTAGNPNGQNNTWYEGGAQYNNSIWNTMELRVAPKVSGQMYQTTNSGYDIYFTNSFQNTSGFCEKEATYETRFTASFPVMGGGTITPVVHDSNCRTLQNCGSVESQMSCNTAASRTIDMSGLTPAPMNFTQPRQGSLNGTTYQIQWLWIDVTSVTCN